MTDQLDLELGDLTLLSPVPSEKESASHGTDGLVQAAILEGAGAARKTGLVR